MSLIVEFRVSSPELPLSAALDAVPGMKLTVEQTTANDPDRPLLFLWATGDDFATFEAACERDDTVASVDVLDDVGDERLYRIQVSAEASVVLYPTDIEVGASRLAVTATHRGLETRMRMSDRESLTRYRELVREMGVSWTLRRVYESSGPEHADAHGLSTKQQTALTLAVEDGYFEVPRDASLSDLADDLDISRQAASERLRRGTALLVENTLGVDD